jgi:NAD+ kinase
MSRTKISFLASSEPMVMDAFEKLKIKYGSFDLDEADVIVALGGDGFMLEALQDTMNRGLPVYGMNFGKVGFLMNDFLDEGLIQRLSLAEETIINPLSMTANCLDGSTQTALAINEVSLLRSSSQAAKLRISIDGKERMEELVCDGALVSTPAGSTAYNYSAHGPILPINADILALTAMAAYRPRRWRGAVLNSEATILFETLEIEKRPVSAVADSVEVENVISVVIKSNKEIGHRLLFDPGHGLEERLISEQFS